MRTTGWVVASLCVLSLCLALAPAAHATSYGLVGSFDQGALPVGVAVNQSRNHVYVANYSSNAGVYQFDSSGGQVPPEPFALDGAVFGFAGVAVDPVNGNVYAYDPSGLVIDTFDPSGNLLGSFAVTGPQFAFVQIATDAAGNVYYPNQTENTVQEFGSSGTLLNTFAGGSVGAFSAPQGVAVDSSGNVYVADAGNGRVVKIAGSAGQSDPSGAQSVLDSGGSQGVAVDPVTNDVFVADLNGADSCGSLSSPCYHVLAYHSDNTQFADFGAGTISDSNTIIGVPSYLAVDHSTGRVYVSDSGNSEVWIFGPPLPVVTTGQATNVQSTSATLNGTVNPSGVQLSNCHFDYIDAADYNPSAPNPYSAGATAPCVPAAGSIPPDSSEHAVSADVNGLTPNTTYHFRLDATSANGTANGQDQTFTVPGPPTITGESVSAVGATYATLHAGINPDGGDTTYHFEYGTTTGYGTSVPVPDADIGSGSTDVAVSQQLTGLAPATTYHFRVVAVNPLGPPTDGPDHMLLTYPPAPSGLPDGRAYGLVTPSEKNGNQVGPESLNAAVAADGQHVLYAATTGGTFGGAGNGIGGVFVATTTSGGWQSTWVGLPAEHAGLDQGGFPGGASPDFSTLLYEAVAGIDPNDQNSSIDVYARNPDGSFTWVSQNGAVETAAVDSRYMGSSADATHVLFETAQALTASDSAQKAGQALYERASGRTALVGVNGDGSLTSACGAVAGNGGKEGSNTIDRAISSDGSRVFFESPDPNGSGDLSCSAQPGGTQPVELYLRQNDTTTTEVSLSQKTGSVGTPAPDGAFYAGASEDGSRVFFISTDPLTNAASPRGTTHLYVYDVNSRMLTFIAQGAPLLDQAGENRPAISADGHRVFFIGTVPGVGPGSGLYLWDNGQISYVSPAPVSSGNGAPKAQVSADGSTLAYTSTSDLTSFDSHGYREVYVYRATGGSLTCPSCDPNGIPPTGDADLALPLTTFQTPNLTLTSDGSRVFFQSPNPLLPQATNGLENVYEYEQGSVHLLSDGNGPYETLLVGASSDGSDVIITTGDSLVPQDQNNGDGDLYDVRIGGGFPAPAAPAQCSGDGCQGAPSPQLPVPTVASVSFFGAGNVSPAAAGAQVTQVKVLSRVVNGSTFFLRVQVPGPGGITITGAGIKAVSPQVSRAGTYQLKITLTLKARGALRHTHKLKLKLHVTYASASGAASAASVSLTVAPAVHRKRGTKARRAANTTLRAGE
jgi:hypothetical protein